MKLMTTGRIATVAILGAAAIYGCDEDVHGQVTSPDAGTRADAGIAGDAGTDAGDGTAAALRLVLTDQAGAIRTDHTFEAKPDVFLAIGPVTSKQAPAAQAYTFQVVDTAGRLLSSDAVACRTFHVNDGGTIDRVPPAVDARGAPCSHAFQTVTIDGTSQLIVQLVPYDDSAKDGTGDMPFRLQVAPSAQVTSGAFPTSARSTPFTISPKVTTNQVCGNAVLEPGEQCDDGNTAGGDGCSARCTIETLCCCGNGAVEPGEQCDDGNTTGGDGCSATCQLEGAGSGD